tara:strand:+ start:277 stop:597 length:321 start_codon:yes stop_codon:yes gene_type:complete
MGKIESVGGEKFIKDFAIENHNEVQNELNQLLFEVGYGLVETFFSKTPQQLTREDMKLVGEYAFKHVGTPICLALRHVIAAWENMNQTTLDNGDYQKELTAREGAD